MTNIFSGIGPVRKLVVFLSLVFLFSAASPLLAQPAKDIHAKERCPVCGMFVAKYPDWVTQVQLSGGGVKYFDGVKDMLAFTFHPASFGAPGQTVKEIWVKDYYTLTWLDGREAWYVIGSEVYGPMGHEFIPFSSAEAAENFRKDHKGTRVARFAELTEPLVQSLRHSQKMR